MSELIRRKNKLLSLEGQLKQTIDSGSNEIEDQVKTGIKVGAIVGGSLLIGYSIFKLIRGKKGTSKKASGKPNSHKSKSTGSPNRFNQRLSAALMTLAYKELRKSLAGKHDEIEDTTQKEIPNS